ncbi:MAG: Uma2 family endonuclease [Microcoleaceae cyanobacterium]
MKTSIPIIPEIDYPESDGEPMAESDPTRDYLIYTVEALKYYYKDQPQAYVSGNLFIYYEQGNPKSVILPDVFVVFDVSNQSRRSYKLWEENNKVPDFVIEITSKSTVSQDQGLKKGLYAFLGVTEYFQYDPTQDYLNPALKGYRLVGENYVQIQPTLLPNNELNVYSEVLNLELQLQSGELRFYDPVTQEKLLSYLELEQARRTAEQARLDAIDRLFSLGLTVEQIAESLSFSIEQVRQKLNIETEN